MIFFFFLCVGDISAEMVKDEGSFCVTYMMSLLYICKMVFLVFSYYKKIFNVYCDCAVF